MTKRSGRLLLSALVAMVLVIGLSAPASAGFSRYFSGSIGYHQPKYSNTYNSYGGKITSTPWVTGTICTIRSDWGSVRCNSSYGSYDVNLAIFPMTGKNMCKITPRPGAPRLTSTISTKCYKKTSW